MIKTAVLGYGTVGSGVVQVLADNKELIAKRAGEEIEVAYVLDLREFPGDPVEKILVHDVNVILADPEVKIVVEVMGGVEPAYTFVRKALEAGKHVTTSNKALVAAKGAELLEIAKEHGVNFMFEASVGGGIPIIRPMLGCLTADAFIRIDGILNGTTNYILTRMAAEGLDYASVLADAQALGYAERDPSADVEGYDACRKIAILASLAWGQQVNFEDIPTEGITKITGADFRFAAQMKRSIKLVASAAICPDGRVEASVAPVLLPKGHPLASVSDVFNGILVKGNMVNEVMFYGPGAGKLPTASAVVGDIVDIARNLDTHLPVFWEQEPRSVVPEDEMVCRFMVRMADHRNIVDALKAAQDDNTMSLDGLGVVNEIESIFGSVTWLAPEDQEVAFVTGPMGMGAFKAAVVSLDTLSISGWLRLED